MIEGYDIICFSNDWDGDPLSKKHIMQRLAQRNRVLWVNSIGTRNPTASARDLKRVLQKLAKFAQGCRRLNQNLYVFSPVAIPFHGNAAARWINQRMIARSVRSVCRRLGFRHAITWTFLPTSADIVGSLGEQRIIYHCVDEYSEFSGTDKQAVLEMERRLMEKADAVIVSSGPLYRMKSAHNPNTHLVTHGVDVAHFQKACDTQTQIPPEMAAIKHPIIGFFGLVADWVDLRLIRRLAIERPAWSFALIGKSDCDTSAVQGLPNVHLLGRKDYALLPAYCKAFDVAILPFVINELTLAANPLKLREYLAAGLPVVASAIPEAERLSGFLRVARTDPEFLGHLEDLLATGNAGPALAVSRAMEKESWDHKVEELSQIVEDLDRGGSRRYRLAS